MRRTQALRPSAGLFSFGAWVVLASARPVIRLDFRQIQGLFLRAPLEVFGAVVETVFVKVNDDSFGERFGTVERFTNELVRLAGRLALHTIPPSRNHHDTKLVRRAFVRAGNLTLSRGGHV